VDGAFAGAVPHVRDAAGREVDVTPLERAVKPNARTALILLSIVVAFFVGIVLRRLLW
jgi:hypothetical protein